MHLDGTERSVSTATLFPDGCYLEPDSIKPVEDKLTGRHEYQCRVVDLNPALKDRSHETVINILASQEPSPSPMPRFGLVKFDDLKITPYVTDQNPMRIRYSLRATGIHPAAPTAVERVQAVWTAPGSPEDVTSGKAGDGMLKDVLAQILETLGVDVVEGIIQGFVS
jgi:hypothetical protein